MMIGARTIVAAMLAAGASLPGAATGEPYPSKPIKVILPYTPGSPNDVIARLAGPQLAARLGQPVVIDNRPGGGTGIGTKAVMGAEPDGYTLLFTNTPTHVIAPLIGKGVSYDPVNDFVPIAAIASTFLVMVTPASIPAHSVHEFVSYAKAHPGELNLGFGQGTLPHLVGELFKAETGIDITSIPYKGGAQAVTDMLGGRVHLNFGTTATLLPLIRAGKLTALAVTDSARSGDLPDVPTMAESGLPNVTTVTYYGLMGPPGVPASVVERLNREVNAALEAPELIAGLRQLGIGRKGGSPQDFAALIAEQSRRWGPIVKAVGFQME